MHSVRTSTGMLMGMRDDDAQQWARFVELYSALVYEWCRRAGINQVDSADVVQEVFRAVATKIHDFKKDKPDDSFHNWLWGITRFKAIDHFRAQHKQPVGRGGSAALVAMKSLPADLPQQWDAASQDSDANMVYRRAIELLKTDFEPRTWKAFWKTTVEERSIADTAAEFGMTIGAVHNARYKVLRRLREEFDGMLDLEVV